MFHDDWHSVNKHGIGVLYMHIINGSSGNHKHDLGEWVCPLILAIASRYETLSQCEVSSLRSQLLITSTRCCIRSYDFF